MNNSEIIFKNCYCPFCFYENKPFYLAHSKVESWRHLVSITLKYLDSMYKEGEYKVDRIINFIYDHKEMSIVKSFLIVKQKTSKNCRKSILDALSHNKKKFKSQRMGWWGLKKK